MTSSKLKCELWMLNTILVNMYSIFLLSWAFFTLNNALQISMYHEFCIWNQAVWEMGSTERIKAMWLSSCLSLSNWCTITILVTAANYTFQTWFKELLILGPISSTFEQVKVYAKLVSLFWSWAWMKFSAESKPRSRMYRDSQGWAV